MSPEVVKTEADIVKSYDVIRRAVEQLDMQPEPGTTMVEMVTKMQLALTVTPSPGANTLQISYLGRDPQRAARMVNRITDVYIDHHNNVYRTQGMHSLYAEQLRILKAQMKSAQRPFRAHLQREHVIDVDQEILLLNQAATLQDRQLREHRLKIVGVQQKLNQLRVPRRAPAMSQRPPAAAGAPYSRRARPTAGGGTQTGGLPPLATAAGGATGGGPGGSSRPCRGARPPRGAPPPRRSSR